MSVPPSLGSGQPRPAQRQSAIATGLIALSALFVASVAAWTGYEAAASRRATQWLARQPLAPTPLGARALSFVIQGADQNSRLATFELILATRPLQWSKGSADQVDGAKEHAPTTRLSMLATPAVRERLGAGNVLIAIGTADEDGSLTDAVHIAGERARQVAVWLNAIAPAAETILTLNLGRYIRPCAYCETSHTSWSRPLAAVIVTDAVPGTNLGDALRAALKSARNIPGPERFSAFALARFR